MKKNFIELALRETLAYFDADDDLKETTQALEAATIKLRLAEEAYEKASVEFEFIKDKKRNCHNGIVASTPGPEEMRKILRLASLVRKGEMTLEEAIEQYETHPDDA